MGGGGGKGGIRGGGSELKGVRGFGGGGVGNLVPV